MTDSKFIDSSLWIAYLIQGSFREVFDGNETLFTSVLSLFEVKRVLTKQSASSEQIERSINFIKKKSLLIDVNAVISELAASISVQHKLAALDAMMYVTAIKNNSTFITLDNDFRGLNNVLVLD